MLLCVPTTDQRGLRGQVAWHVGRAPHFTVVDTDAGSTEVVDNDDIGHPAGQCDTARVLRALGVGAVACRSMARRALLRLDRAGIVVLASGADTVGAVLSAFRAGALRRLTADELHGAASRGRRARRRRRTRARGTGGSASRPHE